MTWEIVGYEGRSFCEAPINWGAAVLSDGKCVRNPVTGFEQDVSDLRFLSAEGHVALLKPPLKLNSRDVAKPLLLACVDTKHKFANLMHVDTGRMGGLLEHSRRSDQNIYVFSGDHAFGNFARQLVVSFVREVLESKLSNDEARELVNLGLSLDSHSPELNALRVYLAPEARRDRVRRLAEASLSPRGVDRFELVLGGLLGARGVYSLQYKEGVTHGGGIDVQFAAKLTTALKHAHSSLARYLEDSFPYLREATPYPRFSQMTSSSAKLYFKTDVESETDLTRLSRFLEIHLLERVLRGEKIGALDRDARLRRALHEVASLAPDTQLYQLPFNEEDTEENLEFVAFEEEEQDAEYVSDSFTLVGYQSGVINDAKEIEIEISSSRRIKVSSQDNGYGALPMGLEYLHEESDFLFKPSLFTLYKKERPGGRPIFYLLKVEKIEQNALLAFNSIPSTVVPGAFLVSSDVMSVRLMNGRLLTDLGEVQNVDTQGGLDVAKRWLRAYEELCFGWELDNGVVATTDWIMPLSPQNITAEQRLAYALAKIDGAAAQRDVVDKINEIFDANVRDNNTRRIVLHDKRRLFEMDEENTFSLTERGRKFAEVVAVALKMGAVVALR